MYENATFEMVWSCEAERSDDKENNAGQVQRKIQEKMEGLDMRGYEKQEAAGEWQR